MLNVRLIQSLIVILPRGRQFHVPKHFSLLPHLCRSSSACLHVMSLREPASAQMLRSTTDKVNENRSLCGRHFGYLPTVAWPCEQIFPSSTSDPVFWKVLPKFVAFVPVLVTSEMKWDRRCKLASKLPPLIPRSPWRAPWRWIASWRRLDLSKHELLNEQFVASIVWFHPLVQRSHCGTMQKLIGRPSTDQSSSSLTLVSCSSSLSFTV